MIGFAVRKPIALEEALARVEERLRAAAASSGPFAPAIGHALARPGKRLRATLAIGAAALRGGEWIGDPDVIGAAAAVELLHEASLLHDDICDGSIERRGAPSVAARFGVRTASLAGAWLVGSGLSALGAIAQRRQLALDFASLVALAEAQILETAPPDRAPLESERERYLRVAKGKTGALFRFACAVGLHVAEGAGTPAIAALDELADAFAVAYQVIDDALDLEGASALGKPGGGDLSRGLVTWPILEWFQQVGDEGRTCLATGRASLRSEILASGAADRARAFARAELSRAERTLNDLGPSDGAAILRGVIARVAERAR